jgi:hypothetical protein
MRYVEVNDVGFEDTRFEYRSMSSQEFQEARKASTNQQGQGSQVGGSSIYYWDVVGKNLFVLAQFPSIAYNVTIWYVRIIPDFGADDIIDEILYPYSQKIAEFAIKKITLSLQDIPLSEAWKESWTKSVERISTSGGSRQSANPVFVDDFYGQPIEN